MTAIMSTLRLSVLKTSPVPMITSIWSGLSLLIKPAPLVLSSKEIMLSLSRRIQSLPSEMVRFALSRAIFLWKSTSSAESLPKKLKSILTPISTSLRKRLQGDLEERVKSEDPEEKVTKGDLEERKARNEGLGEKKVKRGDREGKKAKRESLEDKARIGDPEEKRVKKENLEDKVRTEDLEEKKARIEGLGEKMAIASPESTVRTDPAVKATAISPRSNGPKSVLLSPERKTSISS